MVFFNKHPQGPSTRLTHAKKPNAQSGSVNNLGMAGLRQEVWGLKTGKICRRYRDISAFSVEDLASRAENTQMQKILTSHIYTDGVQCGGDEPRKGSEG